MLAKPEFLTAQRFYLELKLDGFNQQVDGIFLECQGFNRTQDVIEICEVTPNKWGQASKGQVVRTKLPGNVKSGNLTLRRGMSNSITFWNWFQLVQDGNWSKQRKDASLTIYDQAGKPQARFNLIGAWPTSYKLADVSARTTDIEIEEIEVTFEGFKRIKV